MKRIPLTQGKYAIVDDEDFEWLNKWKWCALINKYTWYACRWIQIEKNRGKIIFMHRLIMNTPEGMHTDHKNHKGYDNRKYNLRICTQTQNLQNRAIQKGHSRYKGLYLNENRSKWRGQIRCNGKKHCLGTFKNEIDAAKAYDKKAIELFGEFANTNF
jgi:hypothetical protein